MYCIGQPSRQGSATLAHDLVGWESLAKAKAEGLDMVTWTPGAACPCDLIAYTGFAAPSPWLTHLPLVLH